MSDFPIDVIRSKRRKRTVQAALRDGRIRVMVPDGMEPEKEERVVAELAAKLATKSSSAGIHLAGRARRLAEEYGLPRPASIQWSSRQMQRWGSCTPDQGTIRISDRLASVPPWVLDAVLIHELAHLKEPGHGPEFQELIQRYELTERATGYLMAIGAGGAS